MLCFSEAFRSAAGRCDFPTIRNAREPNMCGAPSEDPEEIRRCAAHDPRLFARGFGAKRLRRTRQSCRPNEPTKFRRRTAIVVIIIYRRNHAMTGRRTTRTNIARALRDRRSRSNNAILATRTCRHFHFGLAGSGFQALPGFSEGTLPELPASRGPLDGMICAMSRAKGTEGLAAHTLGGVR